MTTLAFLGAVAAILVLILALEIDDPARFRRPAGLVTWITHGNWPAKIGGALIIIGVGALLRYALIQIHVPPMSKLISGIGLSMALGLASALVGTRGTRRAVSLALGGAGFGVAYLTAYSAFGLFDYISSPTGLALLGLTSLGAGVFAVTRSALSLAVLSMIGAFVAPAFAVQDPGPAVVYGYYVGASILTLAMVAIRGWRPLIHLSFLFTLAGGIFFAWTSAYYAPPYSDVMLPMLLLLAAVHVAMPVFERSPRGTRWAERLDVIYMIALPTVVSLLAAWIAPSRMDLAAELMCLGAIWAITAVALQFTRGRGVAAHGAIAAVLLGVGIATQFRDLPWELIALGVSVAALTISARKDLGRAHSLLAGLVAFFAAIHILMSVGGPSSSADWIGTLVERLIGAGLIVFAGIICRRVRQSLDTLLLAIGIGWAVFAIGLELIRHDLATLALVFHGLALLGALGLWIPGRNIRIADKEPIPLAAAVLVTGVWAAFSAATPVAWALLFIAPLALVAMAIRPDNAEETGSNDRVVAAIAAPIVAAAWGFRIASQLDCAIQYFPLACAAAAGISALAIGRSMRGLRGAWASPTANVLGVGFAALLVFSAALIIERTASAVILEVLCLAGLAFTVYIRRADGKAIDFSTAAFIVALGLVVQANLMRLVGPPGDQSILGMFQLKWPAVTSLLWASAGAALTIWSRQVKSRALWVSGAVLLVASAVKLVLFDFGSLGQLANILAVIAAGGMFLLVGWLAPMPPAALPRKERTNHAPAPEPSTGSRDARTERAAAPHAQHDLYEYAQARQSRATSPEDTLAARNHRTAWTISLVVIGLIAIAFHDHARHVLHLFSLY